VSELKLSLMRAAGLLCALVVFSGCGGDSTEFVYSSESYFPEDYQSRYQELAGFECQQSPTHGNDYVRILVSDEALPAYDGMEIPDGAVITKPQYADAGCTELTAITVMQKDSSAASGWQWQRVGASGEVESSGQVEGCVGCHTAMCGGNQCAEKE